MKILNYVLTLVSCINIGLIIATFKLKGFNWDLLFILIIQLIILLPNIYLFVKNAEAE